MKYAGTLDGQKQHKSRQTGMWLVSQIEPSKARCCTNECACWQLQFKCIMRAWGILSGKTMRMWVDATTNRL